MHIPRMKNPKRRMIRTMTDIEVINNENEKMPEDIADERSIVFEEALEAVLFASRRYQFCFGLSPTRASKRALGSSA